MLYEEILSQEKILKKEEEYFKSFIKQNKNLFYYLKKYFENKKVFFIGSGSSYNIALFSKILFEKLFKKPYFCYFSSEFYEKNFVLKDSLIIVFSQSGLTSDTKKAVEKHYKNNKIVLFTNNKNAKIKHDYLINTNVSLEKAVQSTKTFTGMLLQILLLYNFYKNKNFSFKTKIKEYNNISKKLSEKIKSYNNFIFLGFEEFYPLSLEGSLKFKEITKVNSESYSSLEYFHGYIEETKNKNVIIILDECKRKTKKLLEKLKNNIVIVVSKKNYELKQKNVYFVNVEDPYINKIIFLQLLAYNTALKKKINPDKVYKIKKTI